MHAVEIFELVLGLLALVIALHWLALKLNWPPATALLVGGGALAFIPGLPAISLDPELALVLFLPPLLMDGAYYTALGRFRRHLPGILSLAVGAVIFTTLIVGVVVHWIVPELPWAACFALGAIVSPPDAVSARAVLKGVHLPRRLEALLEGESLLNDATGLILFRFAVAATLSGVFHTGEAVQSFAFVAVGGVVVGAVVAKGWIFLAKRFDDPMLIMLITILLCWAAYLAGEAIHVSGVIATVTAGLALGWYQHEILPGAVRLRANSGWQILVFVLEALVFILIGFSLRGAIERVGGIGAMPMSWIVLIVAVVLTVIVARFMWVFGSEAVLKIVGKSGLKRARPLGWRQATVLSWAGMRGVVTLAVPLTLPTDMPGRDLMLICAFAVIFVTVVAQGSSLGLLIRRVQPVDTDPPAKMAMPAAEAAMARARFAVIEKLAYDENGTLVHPMMLEEHRKRLGFMERYEADAGAAMVGLRSHFDVLLAAIAAGRAELIRIHRAGLIEDEVLHELERDLDIEELAMTLQRGE
ncbi:MULTISPECIES: Na+/H+ antiporter [unclassified Sphingopyxis]|uniref:Na+/H+ antiporter n=1 Tax=unclassified Sphingopyxis TaxID=2614943 RepID=UPI002860AE35|nr:MULTISPECIES: Na+/H+ antiporter [unclassified Sphingopyxis]MDR6834447.1 CPA1 family monovalent cation:H+ antiporter [Sphingopyxis sp. BE122]MDR7226716.1 CPA1 family monovalent cation:H+ antiporter [Sphingopyxis sp. BE259]